MTTIHTNGFGSYEQPDEPDGSRSVRLRTIVGWLLVSTVLVGGLLLLMFFIAPSSGAAGGCGGG